MPVRTWTGGPAKHPGLRGGDDPASPSGNGPDSAKRIEPILVYMRQHSDKPLQVSALTALASLSPSQFFALFRRATGRTPIDYFIHLRMRRACELLAGTDLSVKEVAAMLGYDDPFYFSRVFKSVNGVAPRDYRVRLAGSEQTGKNGPLTRSENGDAEESLPPPPSLEPITAQGGNQGILHEKSDKFCAPPEPVCEDEHPARLDENLDTSRRAFCSATGQQPMRTLAGKE